MQFSFRSPLNPVPFAGLAIATVFFLLTVMPICHAQDDSIKIVKKNVPSFSIAAKDLAANIKFADVYKKWSIDAWWNRSEEGCSVTLMSPEVVAGLTNSKARAKLMTAEEAQKEYETDVKVMLGEAGDKINFNGSLQVETSHSIDTLNTEWTFYLITEDGKRIKPSVQHIGKVELERYSLSVAHHWKRSFMVEFPNIDTDTKKPILTADTHNVTLAVGGIPGQVKAEFDFTPKKK